MIFAREFQGVYSPAGARAQCLRPEPQIVARARRRGEVEDIADIAGIVWFAYILLEQREPGLVAKMIEIRPAPGAKIIHAKYRETLCQERIAQV